MKRLQHRLKYEIVSVLDKFSELVFPPRCFVCDRLLETSDLRSGRRVHTHCRRLLQPVEQPFCYHCGCPLPDPAVEYCGDCRRKKTFVKEGRSLFVYRGSVQTSMYRFKYANRRQYAHFLAEESNRRLGEWIRKKEIDRIIPVPMYRKKQWQRGYNQAALFAEKLSALTGIACDTHACLRMRDTRPQKELSGSDREKNVKNAFQVCDFVVKYKRILIIDDIYTTGATVEAMAEALHDAGAGEIYVLTACIGKNF